MTEWARYVVPAESVTDLDLALELDRRHVVGDDLGAEALGLGPHVLHEVRAHDAVAEAREVLDLGGVHQRTAGGHGTLEEHRLAGSPGRRRRRRSSRRGRSR